MSTPNHFLFAGELSYGIKSPSNTIMEHLACFYPGTLALSATGGLKVSKVQLTFEQMRDLDLAEELLRGCYETYRQTTTGLAPDAVAWNENPQDLSNKTLASILEFHQKERVENSALSYYKDFKGTSSRLPPIDQSITGKDFRPFKSINLLRPETIESLYILYKITEKQQYRDMGWQLFQAFEKYTKVPTGGYSIIYGVNSETPGFNDKMETFYLGETLKYFYLLFTDEDLVPLDKFVFNTEAHPLPLFDIPQELDLLILS